MDIIITSIKDGKLENGHINGRRDNLRHCQVVQSCKKAEIISSFDYLLNQIVESFYSLNVMQCNE